MSIVNQKSVRLKRIPMIHMTEAYGWKKKSYPEMTIWFNGYLLGEYSFELLQKQLVVFCKKSDITTIELANWIKKVRGHFSIVEKINDLSGSSTNRDEKYKGISSKSMNRWKDELSELDTQLIENIIGRTMTNKVISYVRSKPIINNASINFFIRNNLFSLYMKYILSSILFFMRR